VVTGRRFGAVAVRFWRVVLAALVSVAVPLALGTAVAGAAEPVVFAPATSIDGSSSLSSVSCPSIELCVASDAQGDLLSSTSPATSSWSAVNVSSAPSINAVSCPSAGFCLAVDGAGNAFISGDPAAAPASWVEYADIDLNGAPLDGVACPSSTTCVAVSTADGALISTDGGAAWTPVAGTSGAQLESISCPSAALCVALGGSTALTLTDLSEGGSVIADTAADSDSGGAFTGVSCVTDSLCVGVDDSGDAAVTTNPVAADWDAAVLTGSSDALDGLACPLSSLCVAVDADGNATFTTDPGDGGAAVWSPDEGRFDGSALNSVSCPQSGFCVAVDGDGGASTGIGATLAVALAGAGGGTITDSDAYLDCGTTCSADYAAGSSVTLTATAGPDSTFAGWSGGGCGTGPTCTVTNGAPGSSQTITATFDPPPSATTITRATIDRRKRSAKFKFDGTYDPTAYRCALVRIGSAKHDRTPPPSYRGCRSPKRYSYLKKGRYVFYVYAVGPGGSDPTPATQAFRLV